MQKRTVRLLILLLGVLAVGLTGCDPELEGDPILPGEESYFTVRFEPPGAVVQRPNGEYIFTVIIEEWNGVGADIESIKIEFMQGENVFDSETRDRRREIVELLGTTRIEAFTVIRSRIVLDECFGCDRQNWLIRADDDRGNHIEYSGSVKLISQ